MTSPACDPDDDATLAARVDDRVRAWEVVVERTLETESSVVMFGTRVGDPVVLKVVRRECDEWRSGEVLEAFEGRGMVRVLAQVPGAMLLERLSPATSLADLAVGGRDDEATRIMGEVIGRIPHPDHHLDRFASILDWGRAFDLYLAGGDVPIAPGLVEQAQATFTELAASQRDVRLLHGDLQHYNVVYDSQRGWVAIDPKGVVGELEYEIGAALRNPDLPELYTSRATIERRVRHYSDALALDPARVLAWGFAQAVLSVVWSVEDGFAVDDRAPQLRLAAVIQPMLD
jgi:streptomycin 6-kinase